MDKYIVKSNVLREREVFKKRRMNLRSNGKVGNSFATLYQVDVSKANGVLLTTGQVQYMFNVTHMTIYNWRKLRALPFITLEGAKKPPVRFDEGLILDWALHFDRKIEKVDYKDR